MTLYDATVVYPLGDWRDGQYGRYASAAIQVHGVDDMQRIFVSEGSADVAPVASLSKGQRVKVVRGTTKSGKVKWQLVADNMNLDPGEQAVAAVRNVQEQFDRVEHKALLIAKAYVAAGKAIASEGVQNMPTTDDLMRAALSIFISEDRK